MKLSELKSKVQTKTTLKMSEIGRHPILQPEQMDGLLTYFPQAKNSYPLAEFLPLVEEDKEKVEWDMEKSMRGGMTPAVTRGSESPVHGGFGRGEMSWEPAEFREKVILNEMDLAGLRKIGTQEELESAESVMTRKFSALEIRLLNRLEWMRRQALFDGKVTAEYPNGQPLEVEYPHASYLERTLSGTDLWSDYTDSNPVANLQLWVHDMIDDSSFAPSKTVFGKEVLFHAMQNDRFETITNNTPDTMDMEAARQFLMRMSGIPDIQTYTDKVQFQTEAVSAAANGTNTIELRDVEELEAGDSIRIRSAKDRDAERFEVSSISGTTVTLGASIQRTGGYSPGDPVVYSKYVVPEDHIMIVGSLGGPLSSENSEGMPDGDSLNAWGDVCSTRSHYVDLVGKTGVFQKTIDLTELDPPRWERVLGIRALPRLHYPDAFFLAKVL